MALYCNNWNHSQYFSSRSSSFEMEMEARVYGKNLTEWEHGVKKGYLRPALYGTPICLIAAVGLCIFGLSHARSSEAEAMRRFYADCRKERVTDCVSPKNRQKAELIAQKHHCNYTDIAAYFTEAQALVRNEGKQKAEDAARARLEERKAEETSMFYRTTTFSTLHGREKRIQMLTVEREQNLELARKAHTLANFALNSSQQKEIDWATHGGIAAVIAGTAAGVAVAADIQQKNAQIRAQNAANLQAVSGGYLSVLSEASTYEKQAKEIAGMIEQTKTKLVADTPSEEVLKLLNISVSSATVSETGACIIKAAVSPKDPQILIYEDVPAVVDGTINAHIFQNQQEVGTAKLVLPTMGAGKDTQLEGICLQGAAQGVPCSVTFSADNLWLIEK